ncbi:MAG: Crp/Fnr family transcriptional regulator [Bacteroidia bacterium]|nr:Crp/Fnr family transcriptional regulator [Bacteroidia bacterium]
MKRSDDLHCIECKQRKNSIFCKTGEDSLEKMDDYKSCNIYKKGQTIFQQSQYAFGVYCINAGKAKLVQTGEEGKEQIVRLAKEGDVLGYRALLSGDHYSVTAIAIEDANICFIPKETFFDVLDKESTISTQIMKRLAEDLKRAQERITNFTQKTVRERAAETLLFLKEVFGFESDGTTLNVTLSREEMASLMGTATETTIRLLSELKNDHIIEYNGKRIRLLKIRELTKIANLFD